MTVTYPRRIALDGNHNFRDLGGYRAADGRTIRWRRIFRSDALHELTETGIADLRAMGPRTVFDLRSDYELATDGLGTIYDSGEVLHRHTPFHPNQSTMPTAALDPDVDFSDFYLKMLESARPSIGEIFTALSEDDNLPAIYHCSAGKDRTGVLTALILRSLGIDDDTIVTDYALSSEYITPHLEARRTSSAFAERYKHIPPAMLRAEPETMRRMLQTMNAEFGSGSQAVLACGVTESQIENLRNHLLEG